jgi:hypothetical protein
MLHVVRNHPVVFPLFQTAIREIIANIDLSAPIEKGLKPLINLGLGDPSVLSNFPPAPESIVR